MNKVYFTYIFLFLQTFLFAQPDLEALEYRFVGPTRGGRVTAVAGITSQPHTFYMGATGGGVWKTEDYGTTWKNISDGYFETPSIGAISVAQNDPNLIYVGTGSDGLRSNVITGKGVYKSIDAGKSWTHIGLKKTGQIGAVEIHPTDNQTVFVAAIGQAFQANSERGVYRTKNGGKDWEKVLFISDTTGFADLEFMPTNPNIIYAAAWRAERKPWTIISGGKENGIYKSIDGGDTWQKTGKGLPQMMGKIDLAVSPADSKVLYALVEASPKEAGLYRSDDHGETFRQITNKKQLLDRPFYYTNLVADPQNVEVLYVLSTRYFKSVNGGKDWFTLRPPHGDNHDMWINPDNPKLFIQANDGGANVTHNGGKTWSTQFNQATAELYQVEVDNQYPYWLYAGQQDNYSTISVPSRPPYSHQAGGVGYLMDTGGCETGPAVPNPDNPNIVYSNCKGRFSVYNKKTGQEQRYDVGAANMYGHNPKDLMFRFQRVSPIHVSPHDSKVIYHCSQFVHKSTDEGKNWDIISPDLTAFEPDKQVISGEPFTRDITGEEFYSTIYSLRESPIEKGVIWAGANDGPVHVTQNGGEKWQKVTPKSLPKGGRVDAVEPSPHNGAKAYIAVLRYQLGDWKPYIYKTTNYGKSWDLLTDGKNGIPADYPVRVVREDPDREGLLYAGTEFGMFVSFDDGKKWQAFQQNLPVTPITDIKVHRKDLVISTMGRGFWILDNINLLHQNYEQPKAQVQLYQPKNTYRYQHGGRSRGVTELPRYPKPSVIVDYYLPEKLDSTLQVQILNKEGKVIRSFSNKKIKKGSANRDMATNEFTYTINTQLKTSKGLHRFRWDMRHTGAWDKNSSKSYDNGPFVSPGTYSVRLITGNQQLMQTFEVMPDPRVLESGVTLEDMQKQEKLALEVVNLLTTARKKAAEIDREIKKVEANLETKEKAKAEKERLVKIKDQLITAKGRYPQPMLISQIEYLYGVVRRADQLPGQDVYQRLEQLKEQLEKIGD